MRTTIHCPRCGYDLQGMIASWEDACPMQGVCAECGLEYSWAEVICPEKFEPNWCVECCPDKPYRTRLRQTYLNSFQPRRFWSQLKMSHEIKWRRITGYLIVLLMPLLLLYVLEQSAVAIRVRSLQQRELQRILTMYQRQATVYNNHILKMQQGDPDNPVLLQLQVALIQTNAIIAAPPTIQFTYPEAVIEAVFTPFKSFSSGSIGNFTGGMTAYVAPIQLHRTFFNLESKTFQVSSASGLRWERVLLLLSIQFALMPGLPLGFLLLPVSRRRAKVRWRHVFRVTAYSLFLPMTVLLGLGVLFNVGLSIPPIRSGCLFLGQWIFMLAIPIGLIVWWAMAIRHYLKIPNGWVVAMTLALLNLMVVIAILFNVWPSLLINL
ncbi:MAG: hypothetical protein O7G85_08700 [Planctomycetota bacterium]|nr:hypothetical protein [Planctomycetota bacterium]